MGRSVLLKDIRKHSLLLLIMVPVVAYYLIFSYYPMYGVIIAFKDFMISKGPFDSPWAQPLFKHFTIVFNSPDFIRVVRNTVVLNVYSILIAFPAPIVFALLINEIRHIRFKKIVQSISYLPHFLSWVILSGLFLEVLSPSSGIINLILLKLGIIETPIYFVADNNWIRSVVIGTGIWQSIGWASIIYLASMSSIDPGLYESAYLDGANRFQTAIHITLPSIVQIISITIIFTVANLFNSSFEQIFNLYSPPVYENIDVISTYVYRVGLEQANYSFATAVGLAQNVLAFILIIITNKVVKRFSEYGVW